MHVLELEGKELIALFTGITGLLAAFQHDMEQYNKRKQRGVIFTSEELQDFSTTHDAIFLYQNLLLKLEPLLGAELKRLERAANEL